MGGFGSQQGPVKEECSRSGGTDSDIAMLAHEPRIIVLAVRRSSTRAMVERCALTSNNTLVSCIRN